MEGPRIIVNTMMTEEDYRKFLYITTFRKNKFIIPLVVLISLLIGLMAGINDGYFDTTGFFIVFFLVLVIEIAVFILKIEWKKSQRVKTDRTGTFGSVTILKFYDTRIVFENDEPKSKGELKYDQFYSVMESKDYYIFYIAANMASLIRKKDIDDPDSFRDFVVDKFKDRYRKI